MKKKGKTAVYKKEPPKKRKRGTKIGEYKNIDQFYKDGSGILSTLGDTGAEMFIQHGIPWLGKKAVKMGRYYGSEFLRQPHYQKIITDKAKQLSHKGLDYALDTLSKDLLNKASDKLRPKDMKKGGKIDYSDWYPMELYTDTSDPTNPLYRGKGLDIHNAILKVAPKKGFVMPGHRYTGQMVRPSNR